MKRVFASFLLAFSMYSGIPVPCAKWEEGNFRYVFCFFPLVGALIGALAYALAYLLSFLSFPLLLRAAALTVLPALLTGGIHLDGFLDVSDAFGSRRPKEEKIAILSDPHVGSFAVLSCALYFVAYFAAAASVSLAAYAVFCAAFPLERALSAVCVLTFPSAKTGLASSFAAASDRTACLTASALWFAASAAAMLALSPLLGAVVLAGGALAFACCAFALLRGLGGISGDGAGWLLQVCELIMLLCAAIGGLYL